jgi:hypothetical protein
MVKYNVIHPESDYEGFEFDLTDEQIDEYLSMGCSVEKIEKDFDKSEEIE